MEISFSVKERLQNGKWVLIKADLVAGKTLKDAFTFLDGQEIVAEIKTGPTKGYFVGTDFWLERMAAKGQAMRFSTAIKYLEKISPKLLEEIIPDIDTVTAEFFKQEE